MGRPGVRSFGICGEIIQRSFLSPSSPLPREEPHCHLVSSGAPAFSARPHLPNTRPDPSHLRKPPFAAPAGKPSRLATLSSGASEATPKDRSGQPGSREDMSTSESLGKPPSHSKAPAPRRPGQPGILGASLQRARSVPDSSPNPQPGR